MVTWAIKCLPQTARRSVQPFLQGSQMCPTDTHALHRRVRRTASSMDAAMGKKPNSGCVDFVAPIARSCRADVDDDLALAGCRFLSRVATRAFSKAATAARHVVRHCPRSSGALASDLMYAAPPQIVPDSVLISPELSALWAFAG